MFSVTSLCRHNFSKEQLLQKKHLEQLKMTAATIGSVWNTARPTTNRCAGTPSFSHVSQHNSIRAREHK
jgi:hypothetical protein